MLQLLLAVYLGTTFCSAATPEIILFNELKTIMDKATSVRSVDIPQLIRDVPPAVAQSPNQDAAVKALGSTKTLLTSKTNLAKFFGTLSKYNMGKTVQTKGASIILWLGPEGNAMADSTAAKRSNTYTVAITVMKTAFDAVSNLTTISSDEKMFWNMANCMWLIENADSTTVDSYGSITAYDKYRANSGAKELMNKG